MKKRITSFVLAVIMLFSLTVTAVPVAAEEAVSVTITADRQEAKPGDVVNYTVTLGPIREMWTCKCKLVIPIGLEFVSGSGTVSEKLMNDPLFVQPSFTESSLVFITGTESTQGGHSSDQPLTLFTFQCKVKENAAGPQTVQLNEGSQELYRINDDKIPFTLFGATVNVPVPAFPVTVTGGTGSGSYEVGQTVNIEADPAPDGQVFDKWTVTAGTAVLANANAASTSFTMPAGAVTVAASYKEKPPVQMYPVLVTNGTADPTQAAAGDLVTIRANPAPAGKVFDYWDSYPSSVQLADPHAATTTFVVPAEGVNVNRGIMVDAYYKDKPVVKHNVTVTGGTGSGEYAVGAPVTITAGPAPAGQEFDKWVVTPDTVALTDANAASTTFTMPDADVTVQATYKETTYTVTIVGGRGSGEYKEGDTVNIEADPAPEGYQFGRWIVKNQSVRLPNLDQPVRSFVMPGNDVEIEAHYIPNVIPTTLTMKADREVAHPGDVINYTVTLAPVKTMCTIRSQLIIPAGLTFVPGSGKLCPGVDKGNQNNFYEASFTESSKIFMAAAETIADGYNSETDMDLFTFQCKVDSNAANGIHAVEFNPKEQEMFSVVWEPIPCTLQNASVKVERVTYGVTVDGGTGTGKYEAGAQVTITANDKAGYAFDKWEVVSGGVTLKDANSAETSFVMPANAVEVKATYKVVPYTVTVTGGTGSGEYTVGQTVNIKANDKAGYTFDKWVVTAGNVTLKDAAVAETSFTMPAANVAVKAAYKAIPYAVTVTDGTTASETYTIGQTVNIKANTPKAGYAFDKWEVVSGGVTLKDANSAETSFVMPANAVEVKATYKVVPYTVTVTGGTGSGEYTVGQTVNIKANDKTGYTFDKWVVTAGNVTLKDAAVAETSFTMPAANVAVKATYKAIPYAVTVTDGTTASETYTIGQTVNIKANTPKDGYAFDKWEVVSGGVTLKDANSAETSFVMPANAVEVKAIYKVVPYTVTVTNGTTASETYTVGQTVNIKANAPKAGYVFDKWVVTAGNVSLAEATNAETSFTMPAANVAVKATYKAIPYAVTVTDGTTASETYTVGQTVTITADAPKDGYAFDKWEVVSGGVTLKDANSAETSFVMPANAVKVKATYKAIPYAVTVTDGTGTGEYTIGQTVTITANDKAGYAFDKWEVVSGGVTLKDATSAETSFTMPANAVEVKATYKEIPADTYVVTVTGGTGTGKYEAGAQVTITANDKAGYTFDKWVVTAGNVSLADATAAETSFTMPANAVKVKATYKEVPADTYAVTVNGGTGSGLYSAGASVSIKATAAPEGQEFDHWEVVTGRVILADAASAVTSFTMPAEAVTVKAVYKDIAPTGYTVSGLAKRSTEQEGNMTIALIPDGRSDAAYTVVLTNAGGDTYTVSNVLPGKYTVRVSKPGHVVREYAIEVTDHNVTLDVEICLLGDVNGDGSIKAVDAQLALQIADGLFPEKWTDLQRLAANVDGAVGIKARDAQYILEKAAGNSQRF